MKALYYFTLLFALSVFAPVSLFWPVSSPSSDSDSSEQPSISLSPEYMEKMRSLQNETVAQYQERRRTEALNACFSGKNPAGFLEIAPMYINTLTVENPSFSWSAPCFQDTQISLNIVDNSTVEIIHVNNNPASLLCSDTYFYNMYTNFQAKVFPFSGTKKLVLDNLSPKEMNQILVTGVQIFKICANFFDIIPGLIQSLSLFLGGFGHNPNIPFFGSKPTEYQESQNVKFLEEAMNIKWEKRPSDTVVDLDESLIQSGDFIAVTRFDGIESIIAYGCGSLVGHGTMALRVDGELYIVESQSAWYWPKDGIQMNPYKQWIQWARNAGYHVTWLPLKKEYAEKFDAEAAYKMFKTLEGTPYGFHNFLFGWLDTPDRSYPPLLSPEFVGACMAMLESISPFAARSIFTLALNKRLGTEDLTVPEIAIEASKRGMTMQDLYAIVEEDTWEYPDGKSFVCSAFVTMMWKAGGLFGELKIHATEFTPRDVYQLVFLDPNPEVPENCKQVDPENKFCQIMGKYRMTFPGISTVEPYDNMNEGCWSEGPGYHRGPDQC